MTVQEEPLNELQEMTRQYMENIHALFDNMIDNFVSKEKAVADVQTWLRCEWLCDNIKDTNNYIFLTTVVDQIADEKNF